MRTPRTLSYEQAKRLYDCVGAKQDTKGFYERAALADLVAHLDISRAQRLLEFGCGTGRFAEELLDRYLSSTACYVGLDVSPHDGQTCTESHSTVCRARRDSANKWGAASR
jgi:trans-aconitate methyltransferase